MSRSNPAGFVLGVAFEVAAVVFAVALLPRIDFGPAVSESRTSSPPLSYVNQTQQTQTGSEVMSHWREPPRLITVDPNQSSPTEQHLDQASQKLLNTVGSYAARTAGDLFSPQPDVAPSPFNVAPSPQVATQLPFAPRAVAARPQNTSSPNSPPRPWMRY